MGRARHVTAALLVVLLDYWIGSYLTGILQPSEARWEQYVCHPMLGFSSSFAWGWGLGMEIPLTWSIGLGLLIGGLACRGMVQTRGAAAWGCALLLGDILVGLVDRLRFQAVMDYGICRGLTFNAGDVAGAIAAVLLVGSSISRFRRHKNNGADFSR